MMRSDACRVLVQFCVHNASHRPHAALGRVGGARAERLALPMTTTVRVRGVHKYTIYNSASPVGNGPRALEVHSEIMLMTQLQHSIHLTERGRNAAVAFVNRPSAAPALQRLEY